MFKVNSLGKQYDGNNSTSYARPALRINNKNKFIAAAK